MRSSPRSGRRRPTTAALVVLIAVLAAAATVMAGRGTPAAASYATSPTQAGPINPAAVPLGDGYVSSKPKVGYVDSCITSFSGMGGASADGPWINTQKHTWDYETKLHVNGRIRWPSASYHLTVSGGKRTITFNDLPVNDDTGRFPIQSNDPAYRYDQNPNHIAAQSFTWKLPLRPAAARTPSCTPGGPIGVLKDGVALFNALDGEGRDAGAHEVLDICAGHPDGSDTYHHHDIPPCILKKVPDGTTRLVGYALDGYGIYVVKNKRGQLPNNTQLDACHGTTSRVTWNGRTSRIYHYVATLEYPYTVGCFHGSPISPGAGHNGPGPGP